MAQDSTNPVRFETFWGNVEDTVDALLIFQAIQEGKLPKVRRRLVEKERKGIRSGSIFVFDSETGIKRWTDGRLWSPSRIQGNFLVYREIDKKVPPREKKMQKIQRDMANGDWIIDSIKGAYYLKKNGLMKKTISVMMHNVQHHLICYVYPNESKSLPRPSKSPLFNGIKISDELLYSQNFRRPLTPNTPEGVEEEDHQGFMFDESDIKPNLSDPFMDSLVEAAAAVEDGSQIDQLLASSSNLPVSGVSSDSVLANESADVFDYQLEQELSGGNYDILAATYGNQMNQNVGVHEELFQKSPLLNRNYINGEEATAVSMGNNSCLLASPPKRRRVLSNISTVSTLSGYSYTGDDLFSDLSCSPTSNSNMQLEDYALILQALGTTSTVTAETNGTVGENMSYSTIAQNNTSHPGAITNPIKRKFSAPHVSFASMSLSSSPCSSSPNALSYYSLNTPSSSASQSPNPLGSRPRKRTTSLNMNRFMQPMTTPLSQSHRRSVDLTNISSIPMSYISLASPCPTSNSVTPNSTPTQRNRSSLLPNSTPTSPVTSTHPLRNVTLATGNPVTSSSNAFLNHHDSLANSFLGSAPDVSIAAENSDLIDSRVDLCLAVEGQM